MIQLDFDLDNYKDLLRKIGLSTLNSEFYNESVRKHQQVLGFIKQIETAVRKLSSKRRLVILAGKSCTLTSVLGQRS